MNTILAFGDVMQMVGAVIGLGCYLGLAVAALVHWRRAERFRRQRDDAQDQIVSWSLCPNCGGLVRMAGVPSPGGTCLACGMDVLESEAEWVDPIAFKDGDLRRADEVVGTLLRDLAWAVEERSQLVAKNDELRALVDQFRAQGPRP